MKELKTQKGITLIALIITIVVLLILAVVSIGAVSDSNIIAHAQNAADGYNKEKGIENDTIKEYEKEIEKYIPKENVPQKAKAFVIDENEGLIGVISPDDNEFVIMGDSMLLPMARGVVMENTAGITVAEEISYKKIFYLEALTAVCAVKTDGTGVYAAMAVVGEDGVVTANITTEMFFEFDENLGANYYNDSTEVEYYRVVNEDEFVYKFDYTNKKIIINNVLELATITEITTNNDPLTVKVEGQPVRITENAKRIKYKLSEERKEEYMYIEDGKLYFKIVGLSGNETNSGVAEGREVEVMELTKFVNIGLISSPE